MSATTLLTALLIIGVLPGAFLWGVLTDFFGEDDLPVWLSRLKSGVVSMFIVGCSISVLVFIGVIALKIVEAIV
jgi:hypothetical protein